mgnify:CR=1 FL=1
MMKKEYFIHDTACVDDCASIGGGHMYGIIATYPQVLPLASAAI